MKIMYVVSILCAFYLLDAKQTLGIVFKPVIDIIGRPIEKTNLSYDKLPVAGSPEGCPRLHQLLFNETVEIVQETEREYCIKIFNLFYVTEKDKNPHTNYWTEKENIHPYEDVGEHASCIPAQIDFRKNISTDSSSIVLIKPWFSKDFHMTFSAGTRFVLSGACNRHTYTAVAWHPQQKIPVTIRIPKSYALQETKQSPKEARMFYVRLLKSWAHAPGFIPYVWGGCSFAYTHPQNASFNQSVDTSYEITGDTHTQKCGFDCAGLIARAAQAAGLPYYYKNTATLATYLKPVSCFNELKEGDLIWIPGHVMAVADLKKNTLIEARHYSQGYGKVHEIRLNKVFKGIHSYHELFNAVQKQRVLRRLDNTGSIVQKVPICKLLSIF